MVRAPDVIDAPERDAGPGVRPIRRRRTPAEIRGAETRRARRRRAGVTATTGSSTGSGWRSSPTCVVYVFIQLGPSLVLRNTTITGGDTGAHVWFPDFLIDHFLPWRVAGWSNDFYAGFPAGQFYFPFPAVLIALLDVFLPVQHRVQARHRPRSAAAARAARTCSPAASAHRVRPHRCSHVAATGFLFFKDGGDATMTFDFHIMGGNLPSTLAGEFSFMIALALSLFFLGTLARALDRRGPLWLPAVLLALTILSHVVVALFAVYAGVVIWLIIRPVKQLHRVWPPSAWSVCC